MLALAHGIHSSGVWVAGRLDVSLLLIVVGVIVGAWIGLRWFDR